MNRSVLIIVENLPVPFDRRVWQEANALKDHGYTVSIVCPTGKGYEAREEVLNGITIYRHPLPLEANGALGYALEYTSALWHEFRLAWRVKKRHGFDVLHACNPPDTIFLIGAFFKMFFGKKFIFDHHDINPELFEAKFGKRGFFWKLLVLFEKLTFKTATVSIATNESYRQIAIERGGMKPENVFVVRSGPSLERMKILPPNPALKKGKTYMVGYVGVMGKQEGIEYLLNAAAHLKKQGRHDIHYGLVGGGPELETLRKQAAALGLTDDDITFTGRAPDEELLAMLNTADVCVNPDEYNAMNDKSTMNKIMEYMSLGKPIVQFDLAEGRYSAQAASVYAQRNSAEDLAAHIAALLDHPEKRAEMGAFGRRRVEEELSWPHEVPKLLAAYEKAFANNKAA
jgi:glycosyltransferase involved in cell wall biosynthesis